MTDKKGKTHKTSKGPVGVVGYDEYINARTGEVTEFAVLRMQNVDYNFEKIWLYKLLEALDLTGSAKVKVLSWMLEHRDSENRIIATQARIAEGAEVSQRTVNKLIRDMMAESLISSIQSGVYRLNPDLIWRGKNHKRMSILMEFAREVSDTTSDPVNDDADAETAAAE